ncbi:related to F-box/WD-repeat protein [Cephalotrichum gorgonifer]|uniref:Related to F-box/WD-repeat protein n=1 Tax=Cephalotrichum gorgonifer TaxID=2041049 RepID=A0AAE8N551_9PEZI|nr:related to F-box/WD-repeat protein [Cephalotrichum gorgonifer]
METFPAQPDEGYSEDPLNATSQAAHNAPLSEMPDWLTAQLPRMPLPLKKKLAKAILDALPTSAIAEIVESLSPRLYIDFIQYLPPEVCLKILDHLDPSSLINVARSCRAWHTLALDKRLWRRLYHLEGWSAMPEEIQYWQDRVNKTHLQNLERARPRPVEQSSSRKRPISDESDVDCEMMDADRPAKQHDQGSIFKNPSWSFGSTDPNPGFVTDRPSPDSGDIAMGDSKGKGVGLAPELPLNPSGPFLEGQGVLDALESLPPPDSGTLAPSTLWNWESRDERYVVNWKYLYTMRRRLEANWELGRYTNFQFPHPNHPEEGHSECVYSLQFTRDYLVSGSRDRTLRVWSMHTRRLQYPPLRAHTGSVLCLQFDPDPEEDLIVSGSSDSDVILWKFSTGKIIQRLYNAHRESVLNVKFDKRILVTCSKDRTVKIFNRRPLRYGDLGYPEEKVNPVPIHLKGYGYEPNLAHELPVIEPYTMIGTLYGHGAAVNAVQICGREVVSASGDKAIKVWDWPRQRCTRTILGHLKGIACVQYDGRRIVSGSSDNEVKVFDSSTSLEVASLRAHTNLVRTVQAGFGDLPDSQEEDREAARLVDDQYFRALRRGEVSDEGRTPAHSSRRGNAGSSRPEDITAYGANLPPGGGGGRYARIVSGSYDQSIVIWRRDKEGRWKDMHHLQQEKAATAAQRQTASRNLPPPVRQPSGGPPPPPPVPFAPLTSEAAQAIIDAAVPRGTAALDEVLAMHPAILMHAGHVQAAIDRVSSPHTRNQLRQRVHVALERFNGQLAGHLPGPIVPSAPSAAAVHPAPAPGPVASGVLPHPPHAHASSQAQVPTAEAASTSQNAQSQPQNIPANPQPAVPIAPPELPGNPQALPGNAQNGPPFAQLATAPPAQHHPHIMENSPARIFKLQFDARRIVCCCQTHVIVGWDFCAGDVELEAASRFFATIT